MILCLIVWIAAIVGIVAMKKNRTWRALVIRAVCNLNSRPCHYYNKSFY